MGAFYEFVEKVASLERSGRKITKLHIGDTNMPAPKCAKEAAEKSMQEDGSGYGSGAGLMELREKIARREKCGVENVVVGPGSKHILYALLSVLGKGKKVVFPSPHWPAYHLACEQLGLQAVPVQTSMEENWQFGELPLEGAKMLLICNPLNPTSTVYGKELVESTIESASRKNVPVVIDEAYKGLAHEPIGNYDAIRVRSFSKEFSMEGWRLGYAIAPKEIAQKIISFNQVTSTCVPIFVQKAGIACLENEKEILEGANKIWRARLKAAAEALNDAGFSYAMPQAGIYAFATHEKMEDAWEFANRALEKGVAVSAGSEFGEYGKFVRICLNQEESVLRDAILKMGECV